MWTTFVNLWRYGCFCLLSCKYVTHLYKTSHMSQKYKLSFSYVLKEEKMGFNLVQKIFICDN